MKFFILCAFAGATTGILACHGKSSSSAKSLDQAEIDPGVTTANPDIKSQQSNEGEPMPRPGADTIGSSTAADGASCGCSAVLAADGLALAGGKALYRDDWGLNRKELISTFDCATCCSNAAAKKNALYGPRLYFWCE